ncbi:cyclic nucleotide-binding domain-containing protein [Candidatus Cyanaurora vandensis]|uniref:cyclic nucleotide-binding domain-containing protein n=1 Tax=Candidatus Cyanaurora vandensis TaxID=2714958 RepID=UPI00257EE4AB|nr:cyclic nucleotide-binding domain-containing protein [Candidatus Cyanaurora vandensis]
MSKSLFQQLPEVLWGTLVSKTFAAGEVICEEGTPGQAMYIILAGGVVVCKRIEGELDTVVARFGPGECFGEFALFDQAPRSATVQAEHETRLLVFSRRDLEDLITQNPQLAARFMLVLMDELTDRLRSTNEQLSQSIRWGLQSRGYELEQGLN